MYPSCEKPRRAWEREGWYSNIWPIPAQVWDTSGNPTFKPLSLVFYRQAQSLILVFDVKSMASFRALGEVRLKA